MMASESPIRRKRSAAAAMVAVTMLLGALFAVAVVAEDASAQPMNLIVNGSFETGDFTGWGTSDITDPFSALQVRAPGYDPSFGLGPSTATDGGFAAVHGFDGGGPGTIDLWQDVAIPNLANATLAFDVEAWWDLFAGPNLDRSFQVVIEPGGGGAALQTVTVFATDFATDLASGSGPLSQAVDLSAYRASTVRIKFSAVIPETFTGPALLALDNVVLTASGVAQPVSYRAVCVESSAVQDDPAAAGLGVGQTFRGSTSNIDYVITSGQESCTFNCEMGFDVNCDGKLGDFCPSEFDRNSVAGAGKCLALAAADAAAAAPAESAASPYGDNPSVSVASIAAAPIAVPASTALAHTGAETKVLGIGGFVLVGFGALALGAGRRNRRIA